MIQVHKTQHVVSRLLSRVLQRIRMGEVSRLFSIIRDAEAQIPTGGSLSPDPPPPPIPTAFLVPYHRDIAMAFFEP
jgi:hypothetical protein